MSARTKPPFRADHVGSLLRPKELLQARADREAGRISPAELRELEDKAIRDVVKMQEGVGLQGITDGEYRRIDWFMDFKYAIGGIEKLDEVVKVPFASDGGAVDFEFVAYRVGEKIRLNEVIFADDFEFLKSATRATAKQTIPSPSMMHYPAGRGSRSHGLSRYRRVLRRSRKNLFGADCGPRQARLHVSAAGRHEPRVPERSQSPRPARRGRGNPASSLHQIVQRLDRKQACRA